ncbi:hypothetical protein N5P32_05045 [Marinomonas pontica]|uniref:hypothetical protein n=1 Tax=Marinomonas pontica TaxID=264739 RepID=UPI0022436A78|nr:hypothetical protein [Marinomonas pontica]MCW8355284.1 hypothetical protein [Marinomonas pontica]
MIEFKDGVLTPANWFRQSWQMFEASKSLYDVFSSQEQIQTEKDNYRHVGAMKGAMLLLGLSAENALKGAYIYRSNPDISGDKLLSKHFHNKSHDLIEIAGKLSLELSDAQVDLLERLTIFVQWASKYQAPLRKSELLQASGKLKLEYPSDYKSLEDLIHVLQANSGFDEIHGWLVTN